MKKNRYSLDKLKNRYEDYLKNGVRSVEVVFSDLDHLDKLIISISLNGNPLERFEMLGYLISKKLYEEEISEYNIKLSQFYLLHPSLPGRFVYLFAKIMVMYENKIGTSDIASRILLKEKDSDLEGIGEIIRNFHLYADWI